jgi:hypothetical protein
MTAEQLHQHDDTATPCPDGSGLDVAQACQRAGAVREQPGAADCSRATSSPPPPGPTPGRPPRGETWRAHFDAPLAPLAVRFT